MSDPYSALRRSSETRRQNVLFRIVDAALQAWRDEDSELMRSKSLNEPGTFLGEAERFLDQFLLAYFHTVIIVPPVPPAFPWKVLCDMNPFLARMPELWRETKHGGPLTRTQLDYVGGLLYERLRAYGVQPR